MLRWPEGQEKCINSSLAPNEMQARWSAHVWARMHGKLMRFHRSCRPSDRPEGGSGDATILEESLRKDSQSSQTRYERRRS